MPRPSWRSWAALLEIKLKNSKGDNMKKIYFVLTFLVIAIFIAGCQPQQRLPSPPGAIQVPVGQAGAALPTWAVDAGAFVTVDPASVTVAGTTEKTITVNADDDYVWSTFYILTNDQQWTGHTFDCTPIDESSWCAGSVDKDLDVGITNYFRQINYILVYSCAWDPSVQNFACSGNKWKVATFEIVEDTAALAIGSLIGNYTSDVTTTTSTIASGIITSNITAATGP
ncbi:MAG: hypothetical protein KAT43_01930 [Nanoarchaeota archaeon]|nr:hypothetical protein [Nanoarchaeota archaeon]